MLLNLHSYYSLRYGTMSIEALIKGMVDNGYDTAVLTDINNSSASLDFIRQCRVAGLNGLVGMEFRNGERMLYVAIAQNELGFREINEWMTAANRDGADLPAEAPAFSNVSVVYPYGSLAESAILKDYEYIGVRVGQLNRIKLDARARRERFVMFNPVSFQDESGYKLHRQLRAIDHNLLISQLSAGQVAGAVDVFVPKSVLLKSYSEFPEIIGNTERLLAACHFNFDFKAAKNKQTFTGDRYRDKELLFRYAMEGFSKRYGADADVAQKRVLKELDIIDGLQFNAYFLITDDICRYAARRAFHYVGRGSGANSVVAYCLGITDVDPLALDLYFERFLNPKRKTPPDFDIDFSWKDRDELYGYIFKQYPAGHTALMGAMSTFRSRSIIRELGKVYGLPKGEIDRLVHDPGHLLNKNEVTDMILSVYDQMTDFPNQRTVHASGVLISEEPLTCYAALDYPPKGLPTVQFDMYTAAEISFEKFDILSQRGIGHIGDCCELVAENRGEVINVTNPSRFFEDERIATQLRTANTIGCFYIESPAMRQLIAKLRCDQYLTLVAASSIIRPGVASGGMMKTYIARHLDPESVDYLHPLFEEHLAETYGVMVYQEDVMKVGHYYGGLDLADADVLRRMMSGKNRNPQQLREIAQKFFLNCKQKGYPEEISREIWRQMESFAGFSFNKAHSASYAVESYQSLYLKTYYPLEFMVAVINNHGGFYQRKVYVNEAGRSGGIVRLPCVNKSRWDTTIDGRDIYLGFDFISRLEAKVVEGIVRERQYNGDYTGLENFVMRTGVGLDQVTVLIRSGAFRFANPEKKVLLWEAHVLMTKTKRAATAPLFTCATAAPVLPHLETSVLEDIYDELELIGFPVTDTLFSLIKTTYRGDVLSAGLKDRVGQTVRILGDFVCDKALRTKTGEFMKFGTFADLDGDFFDTVHFSSCLRNYPINGNGVYLLEGKVVLDFDYPLLEVQKAARLPLKSDPRSV